MGFEVQIVSTDGSLPFGDASVQSLLVQLERLFSPDSLAPGRWCEVWWILTEWVRAIVWHLLSFRSRSLLSLFIDEEQAGWQAAWADDVFVYHLQWVYLTNKAQHLSIQKKKKTPVRNTQDLRGTNRCTLVSKQDLQIELLTCKY